VKISHSSCDASHARDSESTSPGEIFDIDDPDSVAFGRSTVELLLPPAAEGEREAILNLLHITWIEVLPPVS
jgi:hypothetical protein